MFYLRKKGEVLVGICAAPKDGASFLPMIQQTELLSSPRDVVRMYHARHSPLSGHANEILEGAPIRKRHESPGHI